MMTADDVAALFRRFADAGIPVWLDGGWGVDALLEIQTRAHDDVDIVVESGNADRLRQLLETLGYRDVPRDDTRAENFVLGDGEGRLVDFHVITFDADGRGIMGPPENGVFYPSYAFEQPGRIDGHAVRCITARYQTESHSGYAPREKDFADMRRLCARFDLPLPPGYPG